MEDSRLVSVASERPTISVITPTYNRRDYLAECISSVQAQSFAQWEHIVVDDGSTDDTRSLVEGYGDPRLHYIYQENRGIDRLGETYNRGLEEARGDYVAILESDDLWPPDKLSKQVDCLDETGAVLSYGRAALIDEKGKPFARMSRPARASAVLENRPPGTVLARLLFHNFIVSATVMIRRETLLAIGGFRQPAYCQFVDYSTYLALSLKGEFAYVDEDLGYWRRHEDQNTFAGAGRVLMAGRRCALEFFDEASLAGRLPPTSVALRGKLLRHEKRMEDYARFVDGRWLLLRRRWQEARSTFWELRRSRWMPLRAAAFLGLMGGLLHFDIEGACRRAGIFAFR